MEAISGFGASTNCYLHEKQKHFEKLTSRESFRTECRIISLRKHNGLFVCLIDGDFHIQLPQQQRRRLTDPLFFFLSFCAKCLTKDAKMKVLKTCCQSAGPAVTMMLHFILFNLL